MFASTPEGLLPGEDIIWSDNDTTFNLFGAYRLVDKSLGWSLYVTTYRIVFSSTQEVLRTDIPIQCLYRYELREGAIRLQTKDSAVLFIETASGHKEPLQEILSKLSSATTKKQTFTQASQQQTLRPIVSAAQLIHTELERWCEKNPQMEKHFRTTGVNAEYALCESYPQILPVPARVSDELLLEVAKFRKSRRVPIVSYVHAVTEAVLGRCSQPKTGLLSKSSEADEECLRAFSCTADRQRVLIADARPIVNAMGNMVTGGGYENYSSCDYINLDIDNIHEMRSSLEKLSYVQTTMFGSWGEYHRALADSKWLSHIDTVLSGVGRIVTALEKRQSVIVHCSDGWDRTSQLVSLASLILDPYYRTIRGLVTLIEKDWLLPGHKFADRGDASSHEFSPVFLQFLDCVFQLWRCNRVQFEYDMELLEFLAIHYTSGRYDTFNGNCDKDRDAKASNLTAASIWDFVLSEIGHSGFQSECYDASKNLASLKLPQPHQVVLWESLYFRFRRGLGWEIGDSGRAPKDPMVTKYRSELRECEIKIERLQAELRSLKLRTAHSPNRAAPGAQSGLWRAAVDVQIEILNEKREVGEMAFGYVWENVAGIIDGLAVAQEMQTRARTEIVEDVTRWVPNSQRDGCTYCGRKWHKVFLRVHHCRSCGEAVCGFCSNNKAKVKGYDGLVRVCDLCSKKHLALTS